MGDARKHLEQVSALMATPALNLEPQLETPRIIHQIYLSRACPPELRRCSERLRRDNPAWDYRLYDDSAAEAFIADDFGAGVLEVYRRISPKYAAARADFLRYLAVYRWGGVYLDVKSGADRPLDRIRRTDGKIWLSRWRNGRGEIHEGWGMLPETDSMGGEFQQWYVAAPAGHPYLRAVIEQVMLNVLSYDPFRHGVGQFGVLRTTGPIPFTIGVCSMLRINRHEVRKGSDEIGLRYSLLDSGNEQKHVWLFSDHYTQCTDPVVTTTGWRELRYRAWRRLRLHRGDLNTWASIVRR